MHNYQLKLKRQIEILGLVISKPAYYKTFDLADIFNCDDITIKRDLRELRLLGIDIHSISKKGIKIENELPETLLEQFILQYSIYTSIQKEFNKANHFLVSRINHNALAYLTLLQMSIDKNKIVKIEYQKFNADEITEKEIEPLLLYQSESEWRVLANNNNIQKTFLISRIKSIELTDKNFDLNAKKDIESVFETSFRSWISGDKTKVKLLFKNSWNNKKLPQIMINQKSTKNADESISFEFNVNSLAEIAQWIAGLGKDVVVVEPQELKEMVVGIASETLSNY